MQLDNPILQQKDVFWNGAFCAFEAKIDIKSLSVNKIWSFPAYVTSFRDSYSPNFEKTDVFGRIDPIFTFTHTSRKVDLGFDVVSEHVIQARENWVNINEIAQGMYATYQKMNGESIISSPPFFGIRFHNLIREVNTGETLKDFVYGAMTGGMVIEPNLQEGYFYGGNIVKQHWALDDPEVAKKFRVFPENFDGVFVYPKSFTVSLSLEVVHVQFRGNYGELSSVGGPSVSMRQSDIDPNVASRTESDNQEAATRQRVKEAHQKASSRFISKMSGSSR